MLWSERSFSNQRSRSQSPVFFFCADSLTVGVWQSEHFQDLNGHQTLINTEDEALN